LKKLRKERGLTLHTLAEKVGSDYQQISRIERGKSKLSIDMLMKVANALETPVADLVDSQVVVQKAPAQTKEDPVFAQEILAFILEKMEEMVLNLKMVFLPQQKASLISQIYHQTLQGYAGQKDLNGAKRSVEASLQLIQTMRQQMAGQ
jgi:transcriptional regulator with XRE-family HTH domain